MNRKYLLLLALVPWLTAGDVVQVGSGGGGPGGGGPPGPNSVGSSEIVNGSVGPQDLNSTSLNPHTICATRAVKGGGYDALTDTYTFTCLDYNWSGEFGGASAGKSAYNTPTTVGGNSWKMVCDGVGSSSSHPSAPEQSLCQYAGMEIEMYKMADAMLALDHTKMPGGKVIASERIYHHGGCGRQGDGVTRNNCPVLRLQPTHKQRVIQMFGGVEMVGVGKQTSDPVLSQLHTGTWWIADTGPGGAGATAMKDTSEASGGGAACGTPGTVEGCFYNWSNFISGMGDRLTICLVDDEPLLDLGDATCDVTTDTGYQTQGKIGFTKYARSAALKSDWSVDTAACIENDVALTGTCSGNRQILCTGAGARAGPGTGGCGAFGTCQGMADAWAADLAANEELYIAIHAGSCDYKETSCVAPNGAQAYLGRVGSVPGATCSTTGKTVEFQSAGSGTSDRLWPLEHSTIVAAQASLRTIDWDRYPNSEGGFRSMSFMPGDWRGRSTCTAATEIACDGGEMLAFGGQYLGGFDDTAIWYTGNNGYGFSQLDGMTTSQFFGHFKNSYVARHGRGLQTGSGAPTNVGLFSDLGQGIQILDNTIIDSHSASTGMIKACFGDFGAIRGNQFIRNQGGSLIETQSGNHCRIERNNFLSNSMGQGLMRLSRGDQIFVADNQGRGNRGQIVGIDAFTGEPRANITIRDNYFNGHDLRPTAVGFTSFAQAAVQISDYGGNGSFLGSLYRNIKVSGLNVESITPNGCLFSFGGGVGTPGGNQVDDGRPYWMFENSAIATMGSVSATNTHAFCLHDGGSNLTGANRLGDIWASTTGLPSWTGIYDEGIRIPDNPIASRTAASVGAGTQYPFGYSVLIHDDITADNTCATTGSSLTGGGTFRSWCQWVSTGGGSWVGF